MAARLTHTVTYDKLDSSVPLEEETLRHYKAERYYPVNIGDVFQDRYSIIGKLGYGTSSTVWLCHDLLIPQKYVALKVYVNIGKPLRELSIYEHINRVESKHGGRARIRALLDSFVVSGPHGEHTCLVHEALGMNMEELKELLGEIPPDFIQQCLRDILRAIHFLHQEAHVIHTDVQPKNILMGVLKTDTAFERFQQDEVEKPSPRKELPDRTIYVSRPMRYTLGLPSLSDFSEARFDEPQNSGLIMPDVYRAPEVILGMPWGHSVDLWAYAMTIWDLFEPRKLFNPQDGDGRYSEAIHLAQMVAIMGPPPLEFLKRSERSRLFWDAQGNWQCDVPIPDMTLHSKEQRLHGEEQKFFLEFMMKTLRWDPEDRCALEHVFMDEFLLADLIAKGEVVHKE
ncbi:unnamed protein product [Zymoseptoria tritici ST99CH_1E4]|uniref:non-specific serine/threonine protein kinase n=1 Tax=Zymoseptoria tritici ST99CH_1E4 TaxID=1276532 RepID=A0A2H1GXV5_ZYMTR|nr:unnamed protein product [Zymoseptoria tritici ST99CH_1E4]